MHFHVPAIILSLTATLLAPTVLASPLADAQVEAPTRASIHESRARTSVAPGCWSGTAFPPRAAWTPFPQAFEAAIPAFQYGNDTTREIAAIQKAILDLEEESGFDRRFILAIMRRESDGQTTIPCNDNGRSCGLMQCHGVDVPVCKKHPCPNRAIHKMIKCGVLGCGPGASSIHECASRYPGNYPEIARCYNTGTVPDTSDYTQATYGIRTYVQDVGNLLLAADYPTWSAFDNGQCGYTNS